MPTEGEAVRPSIYCTDCGRAHPGPECTDPPGEAQPADDRRMVDLVRHANMLAEALRLTQEYVGDEMLPPIEGWSWFDALEAHRREFGGSAPSEEGKR